MFSDLTFTGNQVLLALLLIPVALISYILIGRYRLNRITEYEIAKHSDHAEKQINWVNRRKRDKVDKKATKVDTRQTARA